MDSTFGTNDTLGVGVASALTPSQVQGWAFNHDSPSGLQDAAAAAAAAGGLGLGLGGLGVGGPEQFRIIQVALEQVNRVQSLAREVMFGMCVFHFSSLPVFRDRICKLRPCCLMVLLINKISGATGKTRISRPLMWVGQLVSSFVL